MAVFTIVATPLSGRRLCEVMSPAADPVLYWSKYSPYPPRITRSPTPDRS
jgi:hypothetical protein